VTGFELLRAFIASGGKRLRPAFAYWAFVGCGGDPADPRIVDLGAALEMLHTFALVHDDVMDGSAMRRHEPTVHRSFQALHEQRRWRGESRRFGEGMAVLLGDLAFVYADGVAQGLPGHVRELLHEMKVELHVGQYLDLMSAAQANSSCARAEHVIRFKTAKYSVERPLQLGSALAHSGVNGHDAERAASLREFGLAVGEAFQLRDDLLGAFGDEVVTGKPVGDDFREGKQTPLIVFAKEWRSMRPAAGTNEGRDTSALDRIGSPDLCDDDIAMVQLTLEWSGARERVERRIVELYDVAHRALPRARLTRPASSALAALARDAAWRTR
jgi:geranylgeranyl diphosphate synthase type I